MPDRFLILAAILNGMASLLHVACIAGGARWYRLFGAGAQFVNAAEQGQVYPGVVTSGIALVLAVWAALALSGAGVLPAVPLLKPLLAAITAVYLFRGLAGIPLFFLMRSRSRQFIFWSSSICFGIGLVHLAGIFKVWGRL